MSPSMIMRCNNDSSLNRRSQLVGWMDGWMDDCEGRK